MIKENDFAISTFSLNEQMSKAALNSDFLVIEVTSMEHALTVAREWKNNMQENETTELLTLLLDNMGPEGSLDVVRQLETEGLRDGLVLEGSGGVQTSELDRWSNSGMDVVSSGALTMDSSPIDMTMLMEADR
jgi:nicotinate-nucleotide pyrophosphorylase (carboxylating)